MSKVCKIERDEAKMSKAKQTQISKRKHKIFGRPPLSEDEKRDVKIAVFLTKDEAQKIKEKASETMLTSSEFLRRAALSKQFEKRKSVFDEEAVFEIRNYAQNIRELMADLNTMREENFEVDFDYLEQTLKEQLETLNDFYQRICQS